MKKAKLVINFLSAADKAFSMIAVLFTCLPLPGGYPGRQVQPVAAPVCSKVAYFPRR